MTTPSWITWPYRYALCWVPIADSEKLLRLIPKDWKQKKGKKGFGRVAFSPNPGDIDGISLYRERFTSPSAVDAAARKPGTYYVVRLAVADFRQRNLTVKPTVGNLGGHVSIAELNWAAKQNTPNELDEVALSLVEIAQSDIVLSPKAP